MPLKPPGFPPTNQADWDRWTRGTPVVPDDNSVTVSKLADKVVTDVKLRDSAPASVIGRLASTPGTPSDIIAGTDDTLMVRRSGTLSFTTLVDTDIPSTLARDSEVVTAITAATTSILATAATLYVPLANVLNAAAIYDPPSLADGVGTTTTVTVTGLALGDFVLASFSLDLQGIMLTAWVSATNTASVRFQNESGGTVDLASGTLRVRGWKQ